ARSSWLHRQGGTDEFFAVADKNMPVRVGRRRPDDVSASEGESGFQQSAPADLVVTPRCEPGANQLPFVRVEQNGSAVRGQVDARSIFQVGDLGRFPSLLAGARLQADQFARRFGG